MTRAGFFQQALTSKELKLKRKSDNIAGLQLADILAHPVRQSILLDKNCITGRLPSFARRLMELGDRKFNRQLYEERVEGYGKVFFPK